MFQRLFDRLQRGEDFLDLLGLMQGAQAASADLYLDWLAITHQRLLVDVGEELGLGVAVGVADVVTSHPIF